MKISLESILRRHSDILREAHDFGFDEIRLSKDFSEEVSFIVKKGTCPQARADYVVWLRKTLEIMLQCEVHVIEQTQIRSRDVKEMLEDSVSLENETEELIKAFSVGASGIVDLASIAFSSVEFSHEERDFYHGKKQKVLDILAGKIPSSYGLGEYLSRFYSQKIPDERDRELIISQMLASTNKAAMEEILRSLPSGTFYELAAKFRSIKATVSTS